MLRSILTRQLLPSWTDQANNFLIHGEHRNVPSFLNVVYLSISYYLVLFFYSFLDISIGSDVSYHDK